MSETNQFQEAYALSSRLSALSPEAFVKLIDGMCQAITDLDVPFYGGVNAANISMDNEGNVGLGEPMGEASVRYTADQIEYLAPEVFWNNLRSPQADVYSIGVMMYAWSNGGCLPFLYPNATATDRAEALRRRMSGEGFDKSPVSDTLNRIVAKATAFKAEDRYASAADLQEAFQAFAAEVEDHGPAMVSALDVLKAKQAQEAQMMANILAAAQAAAGTGTASVPIEPVKQQPKKTRKPEPVRQEEPQKKMSLRPLIAVLLIAAILMVAAVAMQFGNANPDQADGNANTSATPVVPTADPDASPDVTASPSPTPTVTPTPTATPNANLSRYTLYKADTSWNKAADNCIKAGATLVCPSNKEEFDAVVALAEQYNMKAVWVGGFRKSGKIVWLDGKACDYLPWAAGEPSANGQHFLMLVKGNDGTWAYRDMGDNGYTNYSGSVCYIMEKG